MGNKVKIDANLILIFSVTLMAVLGLASTTPAFPGIAESLDVEYEKVGLILSAFTIPGVILTPILGMAADRIGRKKVIVPSLLLFGIAGGMIGFVRTFDLILILSFLQGVGASSLGALNVTIIGDMFKGDKRTSVMGMNNSVLSVGTASFPLIGGALAGIAWFYPFFMPFVSVPIAVFVWFKLKNPEPKTNKDLKTYLKVSLNSIKDPRIFSLFIVSIVTYIMLFGAFLAYFPYIISNEFGGSPAHIGILLSSMSLTTAVTSSQLGKLIKRFTSKSLLKTAFLLYAAALVLIHIIPSLWMLLAGTVLYGIAQGINQPNIQSMLAGLAPDDNRAVFMSVNRMVAQLGQAAGPMITGLLFMNFGVGSVFYVGAAGSLAMVAFVVIMIKN